MSENRMSVVTMALAAPPTVEEVMVRRPKVLPCDATVDDVRGMLADDHVHMVLLGSGGALLGTVVRGDLRPGLDAGVPALQVSRLAGRTVDPHAPADRVRRWMISQGCRRLAVVDPADRLLGLLCLKRHRAGFCSDADVIARSCGAMRNSSPAGRY